MLTPKTMIGVLLALFFLTACSGQMGNQNRVEPFEEEGARPLPTGVVPRVVMVEAGTLPTVDMMLLERGQERYEIFCTPCHGVLGDGQGSVTRYGFEGVATLHQERLREVAPEYLFDVITNGFGRMYGYASRIPVEDRWAIVAYLQALQFSQYAPVDQLEAQDMEQLSQ